MSSPTLDAARERLLARFGPAVSGWLADLGDLTSRLAERWDLRIGTAVGHGNTSVILRCVASDGCPAMLKLTPEPEFAADEAFALRRWAPSGHVPQVLAADAGAGALLLEAIPNETPLAELDIEVTRGELADLIGALHRGGAEPAPSNASYADRIDWVFSYWTARLDQRDRAVLDTVGRDRFSRGHELARELVRTSVDEVLLHSDLHPANVLDGGRSRGLVAIDPRPVVGDPAVDAIDWVFWRAGDLPTWRSHTRELATRLDLDDDRLWAWCRAFAAMLAAVKLQHGDTTAVAELLAVAPR